MNFAAREDLVAPIVYMLIRSVLLFLGLLAATAATAQTVDPRDGN